MAPLNMGFMTVSVSDPVPSVREAEEKLEKLPIAMQYNAHLCVGYRIAEAEEKAGAAARDHLEFVRQRLDRFRVDKKNFKIDFQSLRAVEGRYRHNQNQRAAAIKTMKKRWGADFAKRTGDDARFSKTILVKMNAVILIIKDPAKALKKVNDVVVRRLLDPAATRGVNNIRHMTVKDWELVKQNHGRDAPLPDGSLKRLNLRVDELGVLMDGYQPSTGHIAGKAGPPSGSGFLLTRRF